MPGSSTTPGRLDARFHAPTRVAFRIRNGVGTRDKNLCEAQWLACVLLYRRFAAALTGDCARLEADVVSYSFIVSDLHRLLVAGLPAHCERFWTLPSTTHHCCEAWNKLVDQPWRIMSIGLRQWAHGF